MEADRHPLSWVDHFGVDLKDMDRVLVEGLDRGGDYADLYFEHRLSSQIELDEGLVRTASRGITAGVGVRVVAEDQVGFAYSEDLSLGALLQAARVAACIARTSRQHAPVSATPRTFPNRYPVLASSLDAPERERLELLYRADRAARGCDPRISKVTATLSDNVRHLQFLSSEGVYWRDVQPMVRFDVSLVAEQGQNRQSCYYGGGGRYGLEFFLQTPPEQLAREAARMSLLLMDAVDAPAGPMEVVLGAAESGVLLHEAVGHGLEADFNWKNLSNYAGRVGSSVASPLCTIVDSGLFEHSRGSINIDDEGHLPQENVLIEKGILRGYMHDRLSARQMGVAPTGNGRREAYSNVPIPRMTNTYMLPGTPAPEEIIASVKRGIYARRFGGGQVDISKGDFVFSVHESYLIEDGKLVAPLKNVSLVGNGPEVMTRVTMVGNDLTMAEGVWTCGKHNQRVPVGIGIPTVKISEITVGGTAC